MFSRIDKFEQQCVVLKGMLQSLQLIYHIQTMGIDPSLSNNDIDEHKCLENIKKLYKEAGKCDEKQQFKDILESDMFSTTEGFTNDSPISPMKSTPINKPCACKSLCLFTKILYVKKKLLTVELELPNLSARQFNL